MGRFLDSWLARAPILRGLVAQRGTPGIGSQVPNIDVGGRVRPGAGGGGSKMIADFDVMVIGAGIHGAGVAQAAAAEGYSVAIVEKHAPAAGTSSRSSKLIHGGLRYLETAQLRMVAESLRERAILLRIAPHLVKLRPFFIPVYRTTRRRPWQIRIGLSLYAILGSLSSSTRFRRLRRKEWAELDGLSTDGLQEVFQYHDGQTDDAELCRAVVKSSEEMGTRLFLPVQVLEAQRTAGGWSVRIRSAASSQESVLQARVVVNAAGPWANRVLDGFPPGTPRIEIDLVGGAHLEVDGTIERGIYYAEAPQDGRAVFVMPWKGGALVGTTETPWTGSPEDVRPTAEEEKYLESVLHHYFPSRPWTRLGSFAGLRVLPHRDGRLFDRSREVMLCPDSAVQPSLVTIYGGKLTAYRSTAQKVLGLFRATLPRTRRVADTSTLALPRADPQPTEPSRTERAVTIGQ